MNKNFTEEDIQMANKYMQKWSASLAIREMQIKIMISFHSFQNG